MSRLLRIGKDGVYSLLPFLDMQSLGMLDSAVTDVMERSSVWIPAVSAMSSDRFLRLLDKLRGEAAISPFRGKERGEQWRRIFLWMVRRKMPLPRLLEFPPYSPANDGLRCLQHCTTGQSVREVVISYGGDLSSDCLLFLSSSCPELTHMIIKNTTIGDDDLLILSSLSWGFAKLQVLQLVVPQVFSGFSELPSPLTQRGIAALASSSLPSLVELAINCPDDLSLRHISAIPGLRVLRLFQCSGLTEAGAAHLAALATSLKALHLERCDVADSVLHVLRASHPTLSELGFSLCRQGLSIAGFQDLKDGLSSLSSLDLFSCPCHGVTDECIAELATCKSLRRLRLSAMRLGSASLEHATKLSSLQHLDLSHNQSISTGFSLLSRLSSLVSLNLGCLPSFSDADLATLPPSIEELNLDSTGTTDAGLEHLRRLSKLRLLCLDRCWVTSAAVRALEAAVPSLVAPLYFSTLAPNPPH